MRPLACTGLYWPECWLVVLSKVWVCVQIVVNAIVDTLKTAFPPRSEPQSPTEDNEGEMDSGKMNPDKKNR